MNSINFTNLLGFFSTILLGLCSYVKMQNCDPSELNRCTETLSKVSELSEWSLKTKEDLNRHCPDLQKGLECVQSYTRRCMTQAQRSHFNQLYHGTGEMIHELCEDPIYQEEFLRHAPCMSLVKTTYEECSQKYHSAWNRIAKAHPNRTTDTAIEDICCAFNSYISCSVYEVRHTCGKEAAIFTREILDKIANSMNRLHCEHFKSNPGKCGSDYYTYSASTKSANGSAASLTSILFIAAAFNFILTLIPNTVFSN